MSIYLRLYRLVFKYKARVILALLCVFGAGVFLLASPQLVSWAIDYGIRTPHTQRYLVLIIAALAIFGSLRSAQFYL